MPKHLIKLTLVAKADGSIPLIANRVIQHNPVPDPSTSHPHNQFP